MKVQLNQNLAKKFFWVLFSIMVVVMIGSAINFPTNGDELEHIYNGKANIKFYTSMGKDTAYLNPAAPYQKDKDTHLLRYYAVFTDVTAEIFGGIMTKLGMDFMDARHIWNVLLFLLGVLFTGLTAHLFTKNWWAGVLAMLIMIGSPFYTGFSYNLAKDIPMATGFILALYAIYWLFLNFDKPVNKRILAILVAGIAIAIGNRVAGLMLFGYTGVFGLWAVYRHKSSMPPKELKQKVLWISGTLVAGYFAGLLFWPYGLTAPLEHVMETFSVFSKFPLKMSTFFDGENMDINDPYWYFIPKYILITSPILVLLGLALSVALLFLKKLRDSSYTVTFILLAFPTVFPLAYIIYKHAVVYQNWRHVFFIYPTLVVMATLGWYYIMNQGKRWMFVLPVFLLLFLKPVWWMFRNHPYEYTYYNEFVGGSEGAFENYELDSYCFGVKNCIKWISEQNDLKKDTLIIDCNEDDPPIYYSHKYIKQPVKNVVGGFRSRNSRMWDYGVYSTLFLSKDERMKFFPPQNAELVHAEYVDGVPVYIVLKRKTNLDYLGMKAYEQNNFPVADSLLNIYNQQSGYYGNICVTMQMLSEINLQRFPAAVALYNTVQNKNMAMPEMDFYGAVALANTGNLTRAKTVLTTAIENGLDDPNANKFLMQINNQLRQQGGGQPTFGN